MRRVILPAILASLLLPRATAAQDSLALQGPAKWSVELDLGARLPGVLYDEFIERRSASDTVGLRTRYRERAAAGVQGRLTLRLRPEAPVGLYLSLLRGGARTVARFSGGREPIEEIPRSATFSGLELGLTMRLSEWAGGRGSFEYHFGPVLYRQVVDLTPGHRDAFALFGDDRAPEGGFRWTSRSSSSWGVALGTAFRIPLGEGTALRLALRDLVIPVNTAELESQEREEIRALTGRNSTVFYSGYTAHHASLGIGFEYTLTRGRPRARYEARLPAVAPVESPVAPAVANAIRLARGGDTAIAVAALEQRTAFAPEDVHAWRELAVLLAARAMAAPALREGALVALRRALALNPGDAEVLRAYGQLRGLMERAGPVAPEAPAEEPLRLSGLALEAEPTGELRLAWAVHGLARAGEEEPYPYRYRTEIEIFRGAGERVGVRPFGGELRVSEQGTLLEEGTTDRLPVVARAALFLLEPRPGIYSARVRITDLVSGRRAETAAGFEILER